jgi:predicted AAA+ superfamily ATPase
MPKVYVFDTGMVCFAKNISDLRPEEKGLMLEHLILQEMLAQFSSKHIWYWRDKQKHEIDFLLTPLRSQNIHAIECKWSRDAFETKAIKLFREDNPKGLNIFVAANVDKITKRRLNSLEIIETPPWSLMEALNFQA